MNKIMYDEEVPATALNIICLKELGPEYYNWEPEVIKNYYPDIPEINYDKIQAISTIVSTQTFYDYYETFNIICNILNNNKPMFGVLVPCTVPQLCWSIKEASLNDEDNEEYSPEVKNYIKVLMKKDGICRLPLLEISICETLDKQQQKLQEDFEKDVNFYIKKRLEKLDYYIKKI